MPPQVTAPNLQVAVQRLEPHAFSPFGTVIQNPEHTHAASPTHYNVVSANQGSALKYTDVSHLTNYYPLAPSRKPAKAIMNMFVCSPRELHAIADDAEEHQCTAPNDEPVTARKQMFPIRILERHPFTPQTFIPTGLSPNDRTTAYLVIVAPTLPATSGKPAVRDAPYPVQAPTYRDSLSRIFSKARPSPFTNTKDPPSAGSSFQPGVQKPKGPGGPDLTQIQAFIADGSQSVTYGPGTWHAPMVVLGTNSVDFVVIQYANGVALEDCQEIEVAACGDEEGLVAIVDSSLFGRTPQEKAKL